jgi:cbb3-type cytochrome oxidase cytochrome c subunit
LHFVHPVTSVAESCMPAFAAFAVRTFDIFVVALIFTALT